MKRYSIGKLSALDLLACMDQSGEPSFDATSPDQQRLLTMTVQDECGMFDQAQMVLNRAYVPDCLSDIFLYVSFSGIFDLHTDDRTVQRQEQAKTLFRPEGVRMNLGSGWFRYVAFERSANMSRHSELSFVRADVFVPLKERMQLGINKMLKAQDWTKVTSNIERLPYYADGLGKHTPKRYLKPAEPEDLFRFAQRPGWQTYYPPETLQQLKSLITDYEKAKQRCRVREYAEPDLGRKADVGRILYAQGKEKEYDVTALYQAVDNGSAQAIHQARMVMMEEKWQLVPPEDREEVLTRILEPLNEQALFYADVFCDFRQFGFRILGDILLDLDLLYGRKEGLSRWQRKDDSKNMVRLMQGCENAKDRYATVRKNLLTLLEEQDFVPSRDDLANVVKMAYILDKRRFAMEIALADMGRLAVDRRGERVSTNDQRME